MISDFSSCGRLYLNKIFRCGVFITLTYLSACSQNESSSSHSNNSQNLSSTQQDWVKEELLTQVTELRKEFAELRKDVKALDGKVSKIRVAGTQPTRPVAKAPKEMSLNDPYFMGEDDARVMVVEFTDYQCPFCARHSKNVFPEIKKNFVDTGKIRYAIRDYPLGFHSQAKSAAIAANCVGEQGKYWDMHEILFNNSGSLSSDFYAQQVEQLGLNVEKYQTCVDKSDSTKNIEQSLADGNKYGVTGTPKFFVGVIKEDKLINIKAISGAQSYNVFASAIEARL